MGISINQSINNIPVLSREMNSVATRVALLLTLFAIVFANIEIDVTDSLAEELNSLDAGENRNPSPCFLSGYAHCITACNTQPCTATCGFILPRSNTFTCSGLIPALCNNTAGG